MISSDRRTMFTDLYRLAEFYEQPPFQPGDIDGNANWFVMAQEKALIPFLTKHGNDKMAIELAMAILEDANRQAVEMNERVSVL